MSAWSTRCSVALAIAESLHQPPFVNGQNLIHQHDRVDVYAALGRLNQHARRSLAPDVRGDRGDDRHGTV